MVHRSLRFCLLCLAMALIQHSGPAQQRKFLFDATKAEMAGNADWVIDADTRNLGVNSSTHQMQAGLGNESNPQRIPTPAASGITPSTPETYWSGALSSWAVALVKLGYAVETLPYNGSITYGNSSNAQDLANYDVFVVCEPNIPFTAAEKTAILTFVQNGGGLFVVADHNSSDRNGDGWDSPHVWNDLMQTNTVQADPFGMTFNLDDVSPASSEVDTTPADSIIHGPAGNASQLVYHNGSTITISTTNNATVLSAVWSSAPHSNANVICAYARFGRGRVVGVGDSSPCDDGTGDPNDNLYTGWTEGGGSDGVLFTNASVWLAAPGTSTVTNHFAVSSGWNIVSLPLVVSDARKTVLYPTATSSAFIFDPSAGYVVRDTLSLGTGYWLTFPSPQTVDITGSLLTEDTVQVSTGWNLIGAISTPVPVGSIVQIPSGIVASSYFGFTDLYVVADTLRPGNGYWIKVSQNGRLALH